METIHQQLIEAGIKLDSHESDLYAIETPDSNYIVAGYEFQGNVTRFRSPIDGQIWLCIPFANDDFWQKKAKQESGEKR